jgi:hypothetical protein
MAGRQSGRAGDATPVCNGEGGGKETKILHTDTHTAPTKGEENENTHTHTDTDTDTDTDTFPYNAASGALLQLVPSPCFALTASTVQGLSVI